MANSQNGWPVNPPRSRRTIPGTGVAVTVADGPAGDVLMHVLARFDKEVEDIDLKSTRGELDDWGYAARPVRGGSDTSNHASGTAVDVNATRHPLGVLGTFTRKQVAVIHEILASVVNVVRWGGDYQGRKDEMHFEINAGRGAVEAVAAQLRRFPTPQREDDEMVIIRCDTRGRKWFYRDGGVLTGMSDDGDIEAASKSGLRQVWVEGPLLDEFARQSHLLLGETAAK